MSQEKYDPESIKESVDILQVIEFETGQTSNKKGSDNKILCPFHSEKTPSFNIRQDEGFFNCFGCGESGDIISFIQKYKSLDFTDACKYLIDNYKADNQAESKIIKRQPKKQKAEPVYPIPEYALKKLDSELVKDFYKNNWGECVGTYPYKNTDGGVIFIVARFQNDKGKDIIPIYWTGQRWQTGHPFNDNRPMYGIDRLSKYKTAKVLIVEGEKCADAIPSSEKVILMSWSGGTQAVDKTDWSLLTNKHVRIFPDNDMPDKKGVRPGYKASYDIYNHLIGICASVDIIQAAGDAEVKKGYDICDLIEDGEDPIAYVSQQKPMDIDDVKAFATPDENPDNTNEDIFTAPATEESQYLNQYFKFLGWDVDFHHFLPSGARLPFKLKRGGITSGKLLELAPLDFWCMKFPVKRGFDISTATDWLIKGSLDAGMNDSSNIRGAGVWRESDDLFVLNTGKKLLIHGNGYHDYEYASKGGYYYVMSEAKYGHLAEKPATDQDGLTLYTILQNTGLSTNLDVITALGWSLIAPLAGVLEWRPHIWLSGSAGVGKSWLISNIIKPLCGEFALEPSGKTTEAGMRRALGQDARPLLIDEAEPNNKEAKLRMEAILDLCRNASSDSSSEAIMASVNGGVEKFRIRSMFCFASIVANLSGRALESRIARVNIKIRKDFSKSSVLIGELFTELPEFSAFRRRIFNKLPDIINDLKILTDELTEKTGDRRRADMYAPFFASVWNLISDTPYSISDKADISVFGNAFDLLCVPVETEKDEDLVVSEIFSHFDHTEKETISEMLMRFIENPDDRVHQDKILQRYGILLDIRSKKLYIQHNNTQLRKAFENTAFFNYSEILKRHTASTTPNQLIKKRINSMSVNCVSLDWSILEKTVFAQTGADDD